MGSLARDAVWQALGLLSGLENVAWRFAASEVVQRQFDRQRRGLLVRFAYRAGNGTWKYGIPRPAG